MGINLWILYYDLLPMKPALRCSSGRLPCTLQYFRSFAPQDMPDPNCLYLIRPCQLETLTARYADCSFLCIGTSDTIPEHLPAPVLFLTGVSDEPELHSELSVLFHRYNRWFSEMQDAIYTRQPLESLGLLSLPLLCEPISLFKNDFSTFFSVYDEAYGALPENYYQYTAGEVFSEELKADIEMSPDYKNYVRKTEPFIYTTVNGYVGLCLNLYNGTQPIAMLQIDRINHDFNERDFALIRLLGENIMLAIRRNNPINTSVSEKLHTMLRRLLAEQLSDTQLLRTELQKLGWRTDDTYACLLCQTLIPEKAENSLLVDGEAVSKLLPESVLMVYEGSLLLICNRKRQRQDLYQASFRRIRDKLVELNYIACLSNDYDDFEKLPFIYAAVQEMLAHESSRDPGKYLYFYESAIEHLAAERCLKDTAVDIYLPSALLELLRYDAANDGDYVKVLRALLENHMSTSEAADVLYMHRNTVIKRLHRMKERFHMELDSYSYRRKLILAFMLLDMEKEAKP